MKKEDQSSMSIDMEINFQITEGILYLDGSVDQFEIFRMIVVVRRGKEMITNLICPFLQLRYNRMNVLHVFVGMKNQQCINLAFYNQVLLL